jgi:hypothetical protein
METEDRELLELQKASSIIEVAVELGLKVRGGMAKCFEIERHVRDGEKPTLFFNPAKNTFHCRSCEDVRGDVIDLVCRVRGWDRQEAIEWLEHRAEFDRFTKKLYHGKGRKR